MKFHAKNPRTKNGINKANTYQRDQPSRSSVTIVPSVPMAAGMNIVFSNMSQSGCPMESYHKQGKTGVARFWADNDRDHAVTANNLLFNFAADPRLVNQPSVP